MPPYVVLESGHPVEKFYTATDDGGLTCTVELVDSLPTGANLEAPARPILLGHSNFSMATAVNQTDLPLPRGHAGRATSVVVLVDVGSDGRVQNTHVLDSEDDALDSLTIRAVKGWHFQAGRNCDGTPFMWGAIFVRFRERPPQRNGSGSARR